MSDDSQRIGTDGGMEELDAIIRQAERAEPTTSWWDRNLRMVDLYIMAPLRAAWSDWRARVGGLIILFYVLMGTVGVVLVPRAEMGETGPFQKPLESLWYPLGGDQMGQSIGRQIVHATPAMLQMALAGVVFAVGVAVIIGVVSGYRGGMLDKVLMTLTDVVIALPGLPLIIVIAAIYAPRHPFIVGAILAIDSWPGLARAIRSQVLTLREESYVEVGRAMGISKFNIMRNDILPQIMPYVAINAAISAAGVISASAALYFLGVLPFTTLNWGVMMNLARSTGNAVADPFHAGHWLFFPTVALGGLMFGLVLFSQGMDRVFNPRLRARHAKTVSGEGDMDAEEGGSRTVAAVQK